MNGHVEDPWGLVKEIFLVNKLHLISSPSRAPPTGRPVPLSGKKCSPCWRAEIRSLAKSLKIADSPRMTQNNTERSSKTEVTKRSPQRSVPVAYIPGMTSAK
jgi:hypothetical protein